MYLVLKKYHQCTSFRKNAHLKKSSRKTRLHETRSMVGCHKNNHNLKRTKRSKCPFEDGKKEKKG